MTSSSWRLAIGQEVPCFGLTGPFAGSDATSIPDFGIVCTGEWNGAQVVGASGSAELDDQVAAALRNVRTTKAPPELVGREVMLTLGQPATTSAIAKR